ncbi:MAG: PilN domain-containing protein [Rhizobiaceae bacterium]|nr:PilN domain-containing protein [Rhizobiaceae bacterium]
MAGFGQRLDDWFDGPAGWLAERLAVRRAPRLMPAQLHEDGTLHLGAGRGGGAMVVPKAETAPQALLNAARKRIEGRSVSLALPDNALIRRTLTLPAEAAEHLGGIVAARLAALSPFPADAVHAGHRIIAAARDGKIEVEVLIAPKAASADAASVFSRLGASAVRLTGGAEAVVLSAPGAVEKPREAGRKAIKLSLKVVTLLCGISLATLLAGAPYVMSALELESQSFALRTEAAKAKIAALAGRTEALGSAEEQALAIKDNAISIALALDDLARAMPDSAHAMEIAFADGVFTISGRASDVPELVTALEESGRFTATALLGQSADEDETGVGGPVEFQLTTRPLALAGGAASATADSPDGGAGEGQPADSPDAASAEAADGGVLRESDGLAPPDDSGTGGGGEREQGTEGSGRP